MDTLVHQGLSEHRLVSLVVTITTVGHLDMHDMIGMTLFFFFFFY